MYLEKSKETLQTALKKGGEVLIYLLVAYSFDFSNIPGKTRSEMEILRSLSKKVRNICSTKTSIT